MNSNFLSLLYTKSSECILRNDFKGRNTIFIPDFFVIISWMSLLLPPIVLDIIIFFCLISHHAWGALIALIVCSCLHCICEVFINTTALDNLSFSCHRAVLLIVYFFGYGPVLICLKILITSFKIWDDVKINSEIVPSPLFHVPNEFFSILKVYCLIYVVLKCIPQIFILCVLLVDNEFSGNTWFILTASLLINMLILSQMMASLLPIRKTPAYYLTSGCVFLNAMIKYMATMCACCIQVELFSMAFQEIRYYAVLGRILLSFVWLWPCWQVLRSQPTPLTKFEFGGYFILFILVFSFIYIHPFESQGLLHYFIFYLMNIFSEIYVLYTWCNPNILEITYYFCLKIFFFALLLCFGMVNILMRGKPPERKIYTVTQSEIQTEENEAHDEKQKEEVDLSTTNFIGKQQEKISLQNGLKNPANKNVF